jgi:DNA modification methylase
VHTKKLKKQYNIKNVEEAKTIAGNWLETIGVRPLTSFGLPEVDDRYHIWRVPLRSKITKHNIGEIVLDAITTLINEDKSTKPEILQTRILNGSNAVVATLRKSATKYEISAQRNTIALGDAEFVLQEMAARSVDLIFTSPPYYNARPEYSDFITYEEYLLKMRKIIQNCHRVLNEGRFFVMNISPVLLRRASRNEASKRIAVPFDIHRLFVEEGFDFIDDIIWVKPEGAGWATGRGRRFSADRNPLQYKPVPVTEYVLVYRKHTNKLIDWNIRSYPDQKILNESKIQDPYEVTNIWKIHPSHDKRHPAIFPIQLAERIIKYYSFKTDVVLDPFAGIGTTGKAAIKLDRRFVLIEIDQKYIREMMKDLKRILGKKYLDTLFLNCNYEIDDQEPLL